MNNLPGDAQFTEQLDFFDPLKVCIESFEGPLELLLALIRKQKMDIKEISLADICQPYLSYLDRMEDLNLEIAGQFLEVAANLVFIKSKALLPKPEKEEEGEEKLDTEEILRQKLIEYQKFKDTAFSFVQRELLGRDIFPRPQIEEEESDRANSNRTYEFANLSVYNLLKSYQFVLEKRKVFKPHQIEHEQYSLENRMVQLIEDFCSFGYRTFEDLIIDDATKMDQVITFLAILELVKLKFLQVKQMETFSTIHCYPVAGEKEKAEDLKKDLLLATAS